jgi:hypothetical protein
VEDLDAGPVAALVGVLETRARYAQLDQTLDPPPSDGAASNLAGAPYAETEFSDVLLIFLLKGLQAQINSIAEAPRDHDLTPPRCTGEPRPARR